MGIKVIETTLFHDLLQNVQEAVQNGFTVKNAVRVGELFHVELQKPTNFEAERKVIKEAHAELDKSDDVPPSSKPKAPKKAKE